MARRALVIGGSIGGLFAANALRKIGWDATVFERVGEPLIGRGAGIGTHGELIAALRRLGLPVDETVGIQVPMRICLDRSGRVTHRLAAPHLQSSWGRIYTLLREALPAASCRFDMSLERFEQDPSGVTAVFSDGTRERGDLLVGADGIRSTVREVLCSTGAAALRRLRRVAGPRGRERVCASAPQGALRVLHDLPARRRDDAHLPRSGAQQRHPPGRRCYNLMWYRPTDYHRTLPELCTDASGRCHGISIPPPLIRPEVGASVKAAARELLAPQIAALVELIDQIFFQAIFDLESPCMTSGASRWSATPPSLRARTWEQA